MLSCSVASPLVVGIRYRFGVLNRATGDFEMGASDDKPDLCLDNTKELRSVGYKNIAISDKHVDPDTGNLNVVCKMKLLKDDLANHSLSSGKISSISCFLYL
jgi:hypothetical protein